MDNNNIPQPATPAMPAKPAPAQPAAPAAPTQTPNVPVSGGSNGQTPASGSKMVLWFIIGLVVIVALVGGIYLYLSRQEAVNSNNQQAVKTQAPAPVAQENIENDLNNVAIDDIDTDFASLDQDLQQL